MNELSFPFVVVDFKKSARTSFYFKKSLLLMFSFFKPGGKQLLRDVLRRPGDFKIGELIAAILQSVCGNYNCDPTRLKSVGPLVDRKSTGDLAANSTAIKLRSGELQTEAAVKGDFMHGFDNELISRYRQIEKGRVRVENFYQDAFETYRNRSPFREKCPDDNDRLEAFADAFVAFIDFIRTPNAYFEKSGAALFQDLFHKRCVDVVRAATSQKALHNNHFVEMVFEDLSKAAQDKLLTPPHGMDAFDLAAMAQYDQDCFELLYEKHYLRFTYKELEEKLGKSLTSLKRAVEKCAEKLKVYFKDYLKER